MQRIFHKFKDPDSTYSLNIAKLVGAPAGLYHGFDATLGASMNLTLSHLTTGFAETALGTDISGATQPPVGVCISRQGTVILESSDVVIPITPTTVSPRTDTVIGWYKYDNVENSTNQLNYTVYSGAYVLQAYEFVLGVLELPAACTALNQTGVTYTPHRIKSLAELTTRVAELQNTKYDKAQPDFVEVGDQSSTSTFKFRGGWGASSNTERLRFTKEQNLRVTLSGVITALDVSGANANNYDLANVPLSFPSQKFSALYYHASTNVYYPCVVTVANDGSLSVSVDSNTPAKEVGDKVFLGGANYLTDLF